MVARMLKNTDVNDHDSYQGNHEHGANKPGFDHVTYGCFSTPQAVGVLLLWEPSNIALSSPMRSMNCGGPTLGVWVFIFLFFEATQTGGCVKGRSKDIHSCWMFSMSYFETNPCNLLHMRLAICRVRHSFGFLHLPFRLLGPFLGQFETSLLVCGLFTGEWGFLIFWHILFGF